MKRIQIPFQKAVVATTLFAVTALTASAAQVLMVNFSSIAANDMITTDATALGVDAFQNVRTNQTTNTTATINLDEVTGSLRYTDYYQANQKTALGQPYATFVGAKQISAGDGLGLSARIALDLSAWMTTGSYTSYIITVYYAGRSEAAKTLMTDLDTDVHFNDGTTVTDDTMTVHHQGTSPYTAFWAGIGAEQTFTSNTLTIDMDYLGSTAVTHQAGIAAVKIEGVPEPGATLLGALGMVALLRRRR